MSATAETLIHDLAEHGVRLTRHADRLRVEAPPGTVTPELKLILSERKAELLAALSTDTIRARLLKLADAELIGVELVHALPDDDVTDCAGLPDETLRAYLRSIRDDDLRQRGKRLPDETATAICRKCGPVWTAHEIAAVAPMIDCWPRVVGCPSCHQKDRRLIPRPSVRCGDCQHFIRDHVNPSAGMGRCTAGADPDRPTPMKHRECATFRPSRLGAMT